MTHSVKEHNVEGLAGNLMFERMGRMWANLESSSEIYRVDVSWIPYGGIRVNLQTCVCVCVSANSHPTRLREGLGYMDSGMVMSEVAKGRE